MEKQCLSSKIIVSRQLLELSSHSTFVSSRFVLFPLFFFEMSPWTYEAEAALLRTWRKSEAFSEKKMISRKDQLFEWVIIQLEPVDL